MSKKLPAWMAAGAVASTASVAAAGTPTYFTPLTESAPVSTSNSAIEMNAPWVTPAGVAQYNLTSMSEIESDPAQSVGRSPSTVQLPGGDIADVEPGNTTSMWDMLAFDASGRYVFIPHESPYSAGVTRYDVQNDEATLLFQGDGLGPFGDWSNDWGAFDPATFTPNCTLFAAEEWTAEGRVMEITNPYAPPGALNVRELSGIPNVAHEGLRFSADGNVLYFVDEWNSGSLYKIVFKDPSNYSLGGQVFVLSVDDFAGVAADLWNDASNASAVRTGKATWIALTNKNGIPKPFLTWNPFTNGPTVDPRTDSTARGGRGAADDANATPYGRPEDMEVGTLANGNSVVYFTATSEQTIYSVEELRGSTGGKAMVRVFANEYTTPKNEGFAPTTASLNSPDNLAQDAAGNIYIIEDAPNGSSTGGDIWFARDVDGDGVAESLDHFLSIQVEGSEATGMIFNPQNPMQFIVSVQHPNSVDLNNYDVGVGFGDAMWAFDLRGTVEPCTASDTAQECKSQKNEKLNLIKEAFKTEESKEERKAFKQKCRRLERQQSAQH